MIMHTVFKTLRTLIKNKKTHSFIQQTIFLQNMTNPTLCVESIVIKVKDLTVVRSVIAHDFRTPFSLCLYILWTLLPSKPPHSLLGHFLSHFMTQEEGIIQEGLLRKIGRHKMGIYKNVY